MTNVFEFTESLVHIEQSEVTSDYGHFPFQMFVENEKGEKSCYALGMRVNVTRFYSMVAEHILGNAKRVYLSLDFPATGDIQHDFVCVFYYENQEMKNYAIPYNPKNGKAFELITESKTLVKLLKEFNLLLQISKT